MKKQLYTLLLCAAPFVMTAQPTLNKAMDFNPGTIVKIVNCDAEAAGNAGANQTWNFTTLSTVDTTTYTYLAAPTTGNPIPGSNMIEKDNDTILTYYNKTSSATHLMGMVDSSSSGMGMKLTYSNSALHLVRPLSYNATANDSFKFNVNAQGFQIDGEGEVKMKVDGHGTLILPTGTFTNVLRIRIERNEKDTIGAPANISIINKNISYLWFDNLHKAPLFRIDSMDSDGNLDVTSAYLHNETYPVGINDIAAQNVKFNAGIFSRTLVISGEFETGKDYTATVYNFSGQKIFTGSFTANNFKQTLELGSEPAPGFYIVSVNSTAANTSGIIKLVKE